MKNPSPNEENVEMPGGYKFFVKQGEPYLLYNKVERKNQLAVEESIFKYDTDGGTLIECYTNTIILDYDADDKTVFEYKLKGRTDPDYPESPE